MAHELAEIFDAIETFIRNQGGDPKSALAEDSTQLCRYVVETDQVEEALRGLDTLTELGVSATVALDIAGSTVMFSSRGPTTGQWTLTGDLQEIGWPDDRDADSVDTEAIADHWTVSTLVATATVEILLTKVLWAAQIAEETEATVWVGPRLSGFVAWISGRPPESTLGVLLRDGPALVLLREWSGEAAECGPNLTIADLSF